MVYLDLKVSQNLLVLSQNTTVFVNFSFHRLVFNQNLLVLRLYSFVTESQLSVLNLEGFFLTLSLE